MKISKKIFIPFFITVFLLYAFRQRGFKEFHINGVAQGTTYHITYYATDSVLTKAVCDSIFSSLDSSLSVYKSYSAITSFNKSLRGVIAGKHLKKVVEKGIEVSKDSKGIFDMTVMPLVKAWGFGPDGKNKKEPDAAAIAAILQYVGYDKITIKGDSLIKLHHRTTIDVNGIAQGYSVDVIADFLEANDVKDYLVEVGGELKVKGRKMPSKQLMKIGIESPSESDWDEVLIKKIELKNGGAITTSGKYRQFYNSGNKKISHLIDPRTGYTLNNEMVSVTVRANDAITADAYDNVLMGMPLSQALEFLKTRPFLDAYFIYMLKDKEVKDTATKGFERLFINE